MLFRSDRHISEQKQVPLPQRRGKAVFPDHVPRQTGGAAQADGAGQFSRLLRTVQRWTVGHFQHVRHMAGRAGVQNGDLRHAVLQHIQYAGGQIARIQRAGFPRCGL